MIVWLILAVTIAVLYLLPEAAPPGQANLDKLAHFLAFGGLGSVARLADKRPRLNVPIAISAVLAVILEWIQSFVPGRETTLADVAANMVGLVLGIAAALALRGLILRRIAAASQG
jgi:VanZ family protein